MKLDIKTLITLLTLAATLGGFYYTTNLRLNILENENKALQTQIRDTRTLLTRLENKLNRLKKRIDKK